MFLNVDVGVFGDALDPRYVPAEPDHRGIDDRVDPTVGQCTQFRDRVVDAQFLVPPRRVSGVVLAQFLPEHEDVFVHEDTTEITGVGGAADGVDRSHGADAMSPRADTDRVSAGPHSYCCAGCPRRMFWYRRIPLSHRS